jgi:hypothetical protein
LLLFENIYLTNNPEITFFKTIYRRYTNFGKIYVQQKFDNDVQFGSTSILTIQKYSDLLKEYPEIFIMDIDLVNCLSIDDYFLKNTIYSVYFI